MSKLTSSYRWTICGLLFFATTVNYLDRQVLSLLAPELSEHFHWDNADYANITTVFQLVYAISMGLAGRFIDRMGTRWGYSIAIAIWSLGALLHAYAEPMGQAAHNSLNQWGLWSMPAAVLGFMIARAVLAFGEAGNFPAAIKVTAEHFNQKERSLATGIFNSGANVGAILAPLTVPWMAAHWGWQAAFMWVGAVGFIWIGFWQWLYKPAGVGMNAASAESATYNEPTAADGLPTWPGAWAFIIGKTLTDGVWWFFLFWLPKYLDATYQMSGTDLALPLTVLYSMTMIGSIGGGWLPMQLVKRGCTPLQARVRAMGMIACLPLVVLLAQPLGGASFWIPVLCIGIGASAHQAWSANIFTLVSDLFPSRKVARLVGIGGMAGGLGSILLTQVAGKIFDHYESIGQLGRGYAWLFVYCATAYLLAWFIIRVLVKKQWNINNNI